MGHAAEGSLQAYFDREIDSGQRARLDDHLAACGDCSSELTAIQHRSDVAHAAMAVLDVEPSLHRARAVLTARPISVGGPRRILLLGFSSLTRAAVLLLAIAGAGAAAVPGSPVRRALEATIERAADLFAGSPPPPVQAPLPAAPVEPRVEHQWAAIAAADGSVRVVLQALTGDAVEVTVRLTDADRANVETLIEDGNVRFVSGSGRLEVLGLGRGAVRVELPRGLQSATVEVNGSVHVYKQGGDLRLSGPAGEGQGSEVRFRIGS